MLVKGKLLITGKGCYVCVAGIDDTIDALYCQLIGDSHREYPNWGQVGREAKR